MTPQLAAEVRRLAAMSPQSAQTALADGGSGLRLVRARHSGRATSLFLQGAGSEWLLHWTDGLPGRGWQWPADPELPALPALMDVAGFLTDSTWSPRLQARRGEPQLVRLAYKLGRRASFCIRWDGWVAALKLLTPDDLSMAQKVIDVLPPDIGGPRLLARTGTWRALLFDWVDGAPVNASVSGLAGLPETLARLHRSAAPGLPRWSATGTLTKLDRLSAASLPIVAAAATPIRDRVAGQLTGWSGPVVTTHGDITPRNLVRRPDGRLTLLDWDHAALGPAEVDLAGVVGLLGPAAGELAAAYDAAAAAPLDRELLAALVVANRLARLLRRGLAGKTTREQTADRVASL